MFISQPGKYDCTEVKAYHPITVLSFILKMMEKYVYRI